MSGPGLPLDRHVGIFARHRETLGGCGDCLRAIGARADARTDLSLASRADAIVFFADDLDRGQTERFIREWSEFGAERARLVLVTGPEVPAALPGPDPRASVHRRRFWGWALLAALSCPAERRKAAHPADSAAPGPPLEN